MIHYDLHPRITAFTTTKTYGRNATTLCPALGVPIERFARPHQVHGTNVLHITEQIFSLSAAERTTLLDGVDAVIYNVRNACIGISTADCIPVVVYDPEHHCAAAIHAGWRGTVARIVVKAIAEMQRVFATHPEQLLCAIGPGISFDSFEIGDEVWQAFADAQFDMQHISRRYPASSQQTASSQVEETTVATEKWHIDLKECNRLQLIDAGVKPANITLSPLDTMTDDRFYSARREGAATGRILSGIVLR